jgi:hypothetical protein
MKFQKKALAAQRVLASFGYYSGELDGLWGKKSKKAYKKYHKVTGEMLDGPVLSSEGESLGQRRRQFSLDFAKLVIFADQRKLSPQIEDVKSARICRRHMIGSNHELGCAGDLSIFDPKTGEYLSSTEDHEALGQYWEELSSHNRWGGRYNDGNHYERLNKQR